MTANIHEVPLIPYPEGSDYETRMKYYDMWKKEFMAMNPGYFNHDGTQKSVVQRLIGMFTKDEQASH